MIMGVAIKYDDSNFQKLYAEMEPKRRLQAIKGGFRKEANQVRKTAVNNLRSSIHTDKDLEKGVRALVFKKKAGFRVTVGTKRANKRGKGEAGYHTNRRGQKKPILIWADAGTTNRKTKGKSSHSTGRMQRYGFIAKTSTDVESTVTKNIHELVLDNVISVAKRYGCK